MRHLFAEPKGLPDSIVHCPHPTARRARSSLGYHSLGFLDSVCTGAHARRGLQEEELLKGFSPATQKHLPYAKYQAEDHQWDFCKYIEPNRRGNRLLPSIHPNLIDQN